MHRTQKEKQGKKGKDILIELLSQCIFLVCEANKILSIQIHYLY
jgi:hypothetical protein